MIGIFHHRDLDGIIRKLRIYNKMNWISIADKLPERGDTILFCTKTDYVSQGYYNYIDDNWTETYVEIILEDVTHWMPLPLPVKLEELDACFCEHANECPPVCVCPDNCYCKNNTCKNKK